jgi:hypothetical protein
MRRPHRLAALALAFAFAPTAHAEDVLLFNGRDLSGWTHFLDTKGVNEDGHLKMEDVWSVKDGVLRCAGVPNGYIRTTAAYTSFRLRLLWRWPEKPSNSGVLLRVTGPDRIWPRNVEAQLMHGSAGDVWGFGGARVACAQANADPKNASHCLKAQPAEKPAGEWNEYDITVDGERLTVKVNGQLQNELSGLDVVPGSIALQSEGTPIEFRNVVLTPLAR